MSRLLRLLPFFPLCLVLCPSVAAAGEPAPPLAVPVLAPAEAAAAMDALAPRFSTGAFLLNAHVSIGEELHLFGNPLAFAIGGEALWRGVVGLGVGLYASEGSPIVATSTMPPGLPGLGDRVSVAVSLAVRPLAPFAWSHGDGYLARLLGGFAMEFGPSAEYVRTGSLDIPGCAIGTSSLQPAFHYLVSVDVPLIGNARIGWVSLRAAERIIVGNDALLAPDQARNETTCHPDIVEPGLSSQVYLGLSYSL